MGAADRINARLGQAEVAHLALGNEVFHGARDVLHRHRRIDAVLVEQVDVVGAQVAQAVLDHDADSRGTAVEALGVVAFAEAELGCDDDLVAHRRQRLADDLLVELAIGFGGIE